VSQVHKRNPITSGLLVPSACLRFLSPGEAIPHNLDLVKNVRPVCGETDLAGLTSLIFYHMRTNCRPGMSQGAKLGRLQSQDERSHNLHQDIDVLTAAVKISDGARNFSCSSGADRSRVKHCWVRIGQPFLASCRSWSHRYSKLTMGQPTRG
jgi:hypothetical protein